MPTRVDWLLAASRTARPTVGVSGRLRPALNPPKRQGQRPRMQRRRTPVQSRCRDLAGYNNNGQLGDDTNSGQNVPTPVSDSDVSSWLAISAGDAHTCGLAAGGVQDGKAYCWGESPPAPRPEPSKAAGAVTAHAAVPLVTAQRDRVLAGSNGNGQLGDGGLVEVSRYAPTPVSDNDVSSWLGISAGGTHTCGLAAGGGQGGKAYCWGESPPRPAINPAAYQEVRGLHMQRRRTPLLSGTSSSQA